MCSATTARLSALIYKELPNVKFGDKEVCLAGVKRGKVRDDEMTASSIRSHAFTPHGRLDKGRYWIPYSSKQRTPGEWLQVDLRTPTTVTGVVTQGGGAWRMTSFKISFGDTNNQLQAIQDVHGNDMIRTPGEWHQADLRTPTTVTGVVTQGSVGWRVTSFKISFGDSNNHLQVIQDVDGNDMIFQDNTEDTDNHVQNIFSTPIRARFIRLIAVTYYARSGLRLDYLTWTPGEWHQADLRTPTTVTGVVTQGSVGWRLTSFKISFGDSNNHLQVIQDVDGNDMIFQGNTEDTDNHMQNIFSIPIRARFIRLIAVTCYARNGLRLDNVAWIITIICD
ncbi:EGF-like repeat and discoidin I-like domain-containing protein 3 [Clavelina lepadiformis]|uniref:EGF-like repeat and discoidin I-like domain-containing protein 3 n=1 Tax=Clavelina lepadiformis TaxID=159417 RepID=UPI0040438408